MRFTDKLALVTGGTTGIGRAAVERLRAEGARVILTGQDPDRVRTAAVELGATGVVADGLDDTAPARLVEAVDAAGGVLDIVFLNAGIVVASPTENDSRDAFRRQFAINLEAPYFLLQALLPRLSQGASVIVNTSCLDEMGMPGMAAYAATKAALRSLVRTWAAEFAARGIRVNAVAPGPVETPIYGKLGLPAEQLQGLAGGIVSKVPLGRFGAPAEIAGAVAFLASQDATFMTGSELTADGGMAQV